MPYYIGLRPFFRFNAYMNVSDALRETHAPVILKQKTNKISGFMNGRFSG